MATLATTTTLRDAPPSRTIIPAPIWATRFLEPIHTCPITTPIRIDCPGLMGQCAGLNPARRGKGLCGDVHDHMVRAALHAWALNFCPALPHQTKDWARQAGLQALALDMPPAISRAVSPRP